MASNDDGGTFVAGFLLGGIVGAIVGILVAPRAGSETRAELAGQSEVWRDRAEDIAARVRERVGPAVESVRERVSPVTEVSSAQVDRRTPVPAVDGGSSKDGGATVDVDAAEVDLPSREKPA